MAHFILTQPLLSFVITEAKMFKASVRDSMEQNWQAEIEEKKDENHDKEEEEEEEEKAEESQEDAKLLPTIKIKLHCINPRYLIYIYMYYLQHERPCCIGYTSSSPKREIVYPI